MRALDRDTTQDQQLCRIGRSRRAVVLQSGHRRSRPVALLFGLCGVEMLFRLQRIEAWIGSLGVGEVRRKRRYQDKAGK
ncbi:MAG: hypothetical protein ABW213_18275 [Tardiphaga sp.]